jgi:hypothetical protein
VEREHQEKTEELLKAYKEKVDKLEASEALYRSEARDVRLRCEEL